MRIRSEVTLAAALGDDEDDDISCGSCGDVSGDRSLLVLETLGEDATEGGEEEDPIVVRVVSIDVFGVIISGVVVVAVASREILGDGLAAHSPLAWTLVVAVANCDDGVSEPRTRLPW